MQRLSRDLRDDVDTGVRRMVRRMSTNSVKVVDATTDGDGEKIHRRMQQARHVKVFAGRGFQTSAHLDESGDFEHCLKEWTVHFLEKDQPFFCPVETLKNLEIKVGTNYGIKFLCQSSRIHACVHNVESDCEKSLTFTVGNELMLLCRITGCPEERSPNSDDDFVYEGDFKSLLKMLKAEDMMGASISFGCVIFKDFLLKKESANNPDEDEEKFNWESFSG